jgi:apolipoprotein N-acyltransferase
MAGVERLRASAPTAKVALLQPSIGAAARWKEENGPPILEGLTSLTRSAEGRGAGLTVWPEAAYPYVLNHAARRTPAGPWAILQHAVRGPVLTGAVLSAGHGDSYNSAIVVHGSGDVSAPYDKLHLLWFGESVPLAAQLPWLRRTFARGIGMVPGERSVVLEAGPVRAGVLICFEDILPEAGREAAAGAPNLLVNLSNDAWFTGSDESEEHLQLAVLRAVETRRDLVRAVNSGPTSWVDAAGVVRARYSSDLPGLLLAEPALLDTKPTPYVRLGDAPLVTASILYVAWLVVRRRRARAATPGARSTDGGTP